MAGLLNRKELVESFVAVRSFLQANRYDPLKHHFDLEFMVNVNHQLYPGDFEIECRDRIDNESYIVYSDVFKANGYYRPVWSAYHKFEWNEKSQELTVEIDGTNYTFKHP